MFASTFEPSFALAVIVYVPSSSAFILMKLSPVCSIFSLSGALLSHDRRLSSASAGTMLAITSASSPALMFDFVTPSVMELTCLTIAPCFLNTAYTIVSLSITVSLVKFTVPRLDSVDQPSKSYPVRAGLAGSLSPIFFPLSTITDLGKPAAPSAMKSAPTSSFLNTA